MNDNLFSLDGKTALITGASSGLGPHFAKVLSRAGATVILGARRTDKLTDLVSEINKDGGVAFATPLDVTDTSSVITALDYCGQQVGKIDILINNAGVASSNTCLNISSQEWDNTMDTNLKGVWLLATEVAKRMIGNGGGSIVNLASILGLRVGIGQTSYAVSKAGVVQITKSMALELGRKGIRVNALCPGYFKTEMNEDFFNTDKGKSYIDKMPAKRLGQLHELDGAILLLCSEAGSFINGVALPVDGGHLVSSL